MLFNYLIGNANSIARTEAQGTAYVLAESTVRSK